MATVENPLSHYIVFFIWDHLHKKCNNVKASNILFIQYKNGRISISMLATLHFQNFTSDLKVTKKRRCLVKEYICFFYCELLGNKKLTVHANCLNFLYVIEEDILNDILDGRFLIFNQFWEISFQKFAQYVAWMHLVQHKLRNHGLIKNSCFLWW